MTDPPLKPTDYKYSYDIYDPVTGDQKTQREIRLDDVVKGAYTIVDPDGNKRTVEYTADAKHGFKAVVLAEPINTIVPVDPAPIQEIQEQHTHKKIYYKNPSYTQNKGYHSNLNFSPLPYIKSKYIVNQPSYFTPENEIKDERAHFAPGHYFLPAT